MKEVFHPGKRGNKQKVKSENPNVDEFGRILHARHWPPPAWPGRTIILRWQWVRLAKYDDDDDVDRSGNDDEYVDGNQTKWPMLMLMYCQNVQHIYSEQAYEHTTKMTMAWVKMITPMMEIMTLVMMMIMMTKVMVGEILHGLPAGCLASQV